MGACMHAMAAPCHRAHKDGVERRALVAAHARGQLVLLVPGQARVPLGDLHDLRPLGQVWEDSAAHIDADGAEVHQSE